MSQLERLLSCKELLLSFYVVLRLCRYRDVGCLWKFGNKRRIKIININLIFINFVHCLVLTFTLNIQGLDKLHDRPGFEIDCRTTF